MENRGVMNFGRLATQAALAFPDQTALIWRDQSWSWSALNHRVDAMVSALRQLGLKKGDRVLVQARNSNQLMESSFAVFKAGAVWVPVNFRLPRRNGGPRRDGQTNHHHL